MTKQEATQQDAEFDSESLTDEASAGANQKPRDVEPDVGSSTDETSGTVNEEPWEEAATADYQTRLDEFDNVESSTPVVSLPVTSSELAESDLKVQQPGDQPA
jgi:hypothetical protein